MVTQHTVRTTHIQRLIRNGLNLAGAADGQTGAVEVEGVGHRPVEHVLGKAAADLRHAAEELEAERLSVLGWPQV